MSSRLKPLEARGVGTSSNERIEEFLKNLGINQMVLPESIQAELISLTPLEPEVIPGDSITGQRDDLRLLNQVRSRLRSIKFECPMLGNILATDYLSYIVPVVSLLIKTAASGWASPSLLSTITNGVINLVSEQTFQNVLLAIYAECEIQLETFSRYDGTLFYLSHHVRKGAEGCEQLILVLNSSLPRKTMITTNVGRHSAFQCGIPFVGKILWLEWPPSVVDRPSTSNFRVFIHSQVLEKFLVQMRAQLRGKEGIIQSSLCASLARPTVLRPSRASGRAFVDYRIGGSVVGNFTFTVHQEIALIDSFELLPLKHPNELRKLIQRSKIEAIVSKSLLNSVIPEAEHLRVSSSC